MFEVQPVRSREFQSQIADALGCPFYDNTYAFFAGEITDDARTVTSLIGMCQFTLDPEKCVIRSIAAAPGCEDDEAMIVLVRAVMSWIDKAEIPFVAAEESAASRETIRSLGFREVDGEWIIDLKKFYRSPCHYNDET